MFEIRTARAQATMTAWDARVCPSLVEADDTRKVFRLAPLRGFVSNDARPLVG